MITIKMRTTAGKEYQANVYPEEPVQKLWSLLKLKGLNYKVANRENKPLTEGSIGDIVSSDGDITLVLSDIGKVPSVRKVDSFKNVPDEMHNISRDTNNRPPFNDSVSVDEQILEKLLEPQAGSKSSLVSKTSDSSPPSITSRSSSEAGSNYDNLAQKPSSKTKVEKTLPSPQSSSRGKINIGSKESNLKESHLAISQPTMDSKNLSGSNLIKPSTEKSNSRDQMRSESQKSLKTQPSIKSDSKSPDSTKKKSDSPDDEDSIIANPSQISFSKTLPKKLAESSSMNFGSSVVKSSYKETSLEQMKVVPSSQKSLKSQPSKKRESRISSSKHAVSKLNTASSKNTNRKSLIGPQNSIKRQSVSGIASVSQKLKIKVRRESKASTKSEADLPFSKISSKENVEHREFRRAESFKKQSSGSLKNSLKNEAQGSVRSSSLKLKHREQVKASESRKSLKDNDDKTETKSGVPAGIVSHHEKQHRGSLKEIDSESHQLPKAESLTKRLSGSSMKLSMKNEATKLEEIAGLRGSVLSKSGHQKEIMASGSQKSLKSYAINPESKSSVPAGIKSSHDNLDGGSSKPRDSKSHQPQKADSSTKRLSESSLKISMKNEASMSVENTRVKEFSLNKSGHQDQMKESESPKSMKGGAADPKGKNSVLDGIESAHDYVEGGSSKTKDSEPHQPPKVESLTKLLSSSSMKSSPKNEASKGIGVIAETKSGVSAEFKSHHDPLDGGSSKTGDSESFQGPKAESLTKRSSGSSMKNEASKPGGNARLSGSSLNMSMKESESQKSLKKKNVLPAVIESPLENMHKGSSMTRVSDSDQLPKVQTLTSGIMNSSTKNEASTLRESSRLSDSSLKKTELQDQVSAKSQKPLKGNLGSAGTIESPPDNPNGDGKQKSSELLNASLTEKKHSSGSSLHKSTTEKTDPPKLASSSQKSIKSASLAKIKSAGLVSAVTSNSGNNGVENGKKNSFTEPPQPIKRAESLSKHLSGSSLHKSSFKASSFQLREPLKESQTEGETGALKPAGSSLEKEASASKMKIPPAEAQSSGNKPRPGVASDSEKPLKYPVLREKKSLSLIFNVAKAPGETIGSVEVRKKNDHLKAPLSGSSLNNSKTEQSKQIASSQTSLTSRSPRKNAIEDEGKGKPPPDENEDVRGLVTALLGEGLRRRRMSPSSANPIKPTDDGSGRKTDALPAILNVGDLATYFDDEKRSKPDPPIQVKSGRRISEYSEPPSIRDSDVDLGRSE